MTDAKTIQRLRKNLFKHKVLAAMLEKKFASLMADYTECDRQRDDAVRIVGIVQTERNAMIAAWREFIASDKGPEALEKLNQPFR